MVTSICNAYWFPIIDRPIPDEGNHHEAWCRNRITTLRQVIAGEVPCDYSCDHFTHVRNAKIALDKIEKHLGERPGGLCCEPLSSESNVRQHYI